MGGTNFGGRKRSLSWAAKIGGEVGVGWGVGVGGVENGCDLGPVGGERPPGGDVGDAPDEKERQGGR